MSASSKSALVTPCLYQLLPQVELGCLRSRGLRDAYKQIRISINLSPGLPNPSIGGIPPFWDIDFLIPDTDG